LKSKEISLQQILELARLAGEENPETLNLIGIAAISEDEEILQDLTEWLAYKAIPQIVNPNPFFPPPQQEELEGDIYLGEVIL
jgi:hypothetical protein